MQNCLEKKETHEKFHNQQMNRMLKIESYTIQNETIGICFQIFLQQFYRLKMVQSIDLLR